MRLLRALTPPVLVLIAALIPTAIALLRATGHL